MKKSCFEKIQAKSIFFEKIQGEISHFFETNQLKNMIFLPKKCIEKRVMRKFDESLAKVSLKLSVAIRKFQRNFRWNFRWPYESFMKLSVARWKFHETFGGQMKVSWNFHWHRKVSWNFRMESESFLKLSCGQRKLHRKFRWNFRMATESFSETFAKLSRDSFFDAFFRQKNMFFSCFFLKKWEISPWILSKKRFSLEFSSKNDFFLDLSKRCFLFYWNFLPEVN